MVAMVAMRRRYLNREICDLPDRIISLRKSSQTKNIRYMFIRYIEASSPNHCCREKEINNIYSNFYVLLTVHFSIILDDDQLDKHLRYFTIRLL
jgi:hypothetical protein